MTRHFRPETLTSKWDGLASVRNTDFAWDGSAYGALSRTMGATPEGLQSHAEALGPLTDDAPSGFPSQKNLRDALGELMIEKVYGRVRGVGDVTKEQQTGAAPTS